MPGERESQGGGACDLRVAFLGATGGLGRALARRMAARGDELFLLGRTEEELDRCARDLKIRGACGRVEYAPFDLLDGAGAAPALDLAVGSLGGLDTVVACAGLFAPHEELEEDHELRGRLISINFTGTIHFLEAARARLMERGGGTLCVFGSVAGDCPRKPVALYGATKAALAYYMEGLDRRYRRRGLRAVLVKPGFVRTAMTSGLRDPPFASDPERTTEPLLSAIDGGRPVVYAPGIWRPVMAALRRLPRFVMRRLEV
ncbi:MAG: SDR family NAD(P)-dependent oxidoreductase [Planctomycetota bacterium]